MQDHEIENQPTVSTQDNEEIVVGRFPRGLLWVATGGFVFGLVMAVCAYLDEQMMSTQSGRIAIVSLLSLTFWLPAILCTWMIIRVRVIADETGLRWRGMGGWKSATWMQVRDYYIKVAAHQNSSRNSSYIVETANGNFNLKDLTHGAQLRAIIQERARWAQAKNWEERGKPKDALELSTPETFTVDKKEIRNFWIMFFVVIFILPLLILFKGNTVWSGPLLAYKSIEETWRTLGAL